MRTTRNPTRRLFGLLLAVLIVMTVWLSLGAAINQGRDGFRCEIRENVRGIEQADC